MSEIFDESSNTSGVDSIGTSDGVKIEIKNRDVGAGSKRGAQLSVESSESEQRSSRRRIKTTRFDNDNFLDNEEQRLLQQVCCLLMFVVQ